MGARQAFVVFYKELEHARPKLLAYQTYFNAHYEMRI